jgi:hypothetical protein
MMIRRTGHRLFGFRKGVTEVFSGDDLKKIDRENALRILPRLRAA